MERKIPNISHSYASTYEKASFHFVGQAKESPYIWINSCGCDDQMPPPHTVIRPGGRADYFFCYLQAGKIHLKHDDKVITIKKGNVFFFTPHDPQIYYYDQADPLCSLWVQFTGGGAEDMLKQLACKPFIPYEVGYIPEIKPLILKIIGEINNSRPSSTFYAATLFGQVLALTNKRLREPSDLHISDKLASIDQSVQYIQENLSADLSVAALASQAFLSVNEYIHSFKLQIGATPRQYINHQRLQKAIALMQLTDLTIGEIARAAGYPDPLYFSKVFHKQMGMPPSQYLKCLSAPSSEHAENRGGD